MVETTIKNINISKHDTKLISVVRLVIVIKCAPEISLVQVFWPLSQDHLKNKVISTYNL